mgnify:FL=1
MLQRMSSRELSEWMAYYNIEPFGEERADLRSGIVASTIANVNRDPKKGQPFKPTDFMPLSEMAEEDEEPEAQEPEVIAAKFDAIMGI